MIQATTDDAPKSGAITPASELGSRVDGDISDIFFNTDLRSAELPVDKDGVFQGYDDALLAIEAELFLNCLYRLGVIVPSSQALIANFYSRI